MGIGDSVSLNLADLNGDGWLDMIAGILGHRQRHKDTIRVFFGGPDGYHNENVQEYFWRDTVARYTGVADLNNDGNLDLLVSAYGTPTSTRFLLHNYSGVMAINSILKILLIFPLMVRRMYCK